MKRQKLFLNKCAISPVLSNLLLTVIAVGAMALATTAAYVISHNMHDIMGERFVIEDVWFKPDGGIAVYVRNIGKVSIEIVAVYINYTAQSFTPLTLEVSDHDWIDISYSWSSGEVYNIKIVTRRGNQLAEFYQAPS